MIPNRNKSGIRPKIDFKLILGILGAITFFMGFALITPIPIALIYGESFWWTYLVSAGFAFVVGGMFYFVFKPNDEIRPREAFFIVSVTWIVLSLFGSTPFMLTNVLADFSDAFFETMSGLTTTGATIFGGVTSVGHVNMDIESLPKSILFWRSMLHWIGGMGFIVLSVAILPFLSLGSTNLFQAESSVLENDKITPRVQQTAKFLWVVYFGFTVVHFILLWIHPKMDWFDALNHAMSTLATGGFSTKDSSISWYDSTYIDIVVIVFMYLAGISFAMHFRLLRGEVNNFFRNRETRFYTVVSAISIIAISFSLWYQGDYDVIEALRFGSFQALSILTTTGYGTDDYAVWPSLALVMLLFLFFTGACAGSTSGGIKMFRHMILIRTIGREIRQSVHPRAVLPLRVGNRIIEPPMVRKILSFFMLYAMLFLSGAVILSLLGVDPVSALGASIATLGSIGPAVGEFGPTSNYAGLPETGKWLLSALMLIGRLELFTVMVLFSTPYWKE
jgi:trk system potassium uptake protein TrkH